jgi:cytoskeletal protein RodZ
VLRAAREAQGRTLPQLAEATRVRRAYLQAIEDMRPDLLPSRPFAVGYAKAYARALGLDAEDLAERLRPNSGRRRRARAARSGGRRQ